MVNVNLLALIPHYWERLFLTLFNDLEDSYSKENKVFPILLGFLVLLLICLILVPVNIHSFESQGYHPYALSLCRDKCFTNKRKDFLSFHHTKSLSVYVGILALTLIFLLYPHQHFYYIKGRNYKDMFWPCKVLMLRILAIVISSVPLLIGFIIRIFLNSWVNFIVTSLCSCLFFISYATLYPVILKTLNVDFPCDLFLTGYYVKINHLERIIKSLQFDFRYNYDTISLLEKRNHNEMIKVVNPEEFR